MRIRSRLAGFTLLLAAAAMLLPAAASAQDAEAVINYRKGVMQGFRHANGALRAISRDGVDFSDDHVLQNALIIQALANMVGDLFPEGTAEGETRALAAIWENPSDFQMKVDAMSSAADASVAAARSGNGVADAQAAMGQGCQGCHGDYRARPDRGR